MRRVDTLNFFEMKTNRLTTSLPFESKELFVEAELDKGEEPKTKTNMILTWKVEQPLLHIELFKARDHPVRET